MSDDIVQQLRDRRDEDGYCLVCGDGKWESHFPECVMSNAADEIERLRALITEWYEAECAELRHFPPGLEAMTRASKAREALFKETNQ